MPVDERLRQGFADNAEAVLSDVELRLSEVRRRHARRRGLTGGAVATTLMAVVVALVLLAPSGLSSLLPEDKPSREPVALPSGDGSAGPERTLPLGRYVRDVSAEEASTAGLPRGEIRWLYRGGSTARVEMVFRQDPDGSGGLNGWVVWFVAEDGTKTGRDAGSFYYDDEGALVTLSKYIWTEGALAHYHWRLRDDRLLLTATPDTIDRPMVQILQGGVWKRQSR